MTIAVRSLISPSRYVQGRGAIARLGEFLAAIGKQPLLVADKDVWGIVGDAVTASLGEAGLPVDREEFAGYTTAATIDRLAQAIKDKGADVIVGFGGGSTIDAAKGAGHLTGIRWASVPTVASTDAPCSALSVVYTAEGNFEEYRFFPHNPDLVLVDSQIVANAPVRFLVAGIGDALATWPEARATGRAGALAMSGGLPTKAGMALAELSWDILHESGLAAVAAVKDHLVTPAVENVIEANTLLSGLGFESGGLAAAHSVHDGLTAVPQTHGLTHGEKVNIGTCTQFILEDAPMDEFEDFVVFTTRLGLPNTLTEAGLDAGDVESLTTVAKAATAEGETINGAFPAVSWEDVLACLRSVERLSREIRDGHGLPEPTPIGGGH